MKRLTYGRKVNIGAESASILWLSDRRTEALALDPRIVWLEFDESLHRRLWKRLRDIVLKEWITKSPGTRPTAWWAYDAPRQPRGNFVDCYWDGKLPEPRRKLSGAGFPAWEGRYNMVPSYDHGIPNYWSGVDLKDLPCFEPEAAYLKRHGLLTSVETRKLRRSDFETVEQAGYDPDDYPDRPWREVIKEKVLARVVAGEETEERARVLLTELGMAL
jgi:hypothetical protein